MYPCFSPKKLSKTSGVKTLTVDNLQVVSDIVENEGDYQCLSCGIHLAAYRDLVGHKKKCADLRHGYSLISGISIVKFHSAPSPIDTRGQYY